MRAWQFFFHAHCALIFLILGAACSNVVAQEAKYLAIYDKIEQADSLDAKGKTAAALAKYVEAQAQLVELRKEDPSWNRDMVAYRLNYLAEKMAACQAKLKPAEANSSSSSDTNTQTPTTASPPNKPTAKRPTRSNQPIVRLLDPGSEPRRVLRFQPKAGDTQTVGFTVKVAIEPGPLTNLPPIVQTVQVSIKNVLANGDIEYETVITDVSVTGSPDTPAQLAGNLQEAFAYVKGLTTAGLLSSRGLSKMTKTTSAKSDKVPAPIARLFQAHMTRGLDIVSPPLPEEAVGAGGKWEVEQEADGAVEKAVYEIASMEENRVTAKATITIPLSKPKTGGTTMAGEGRGEMTMNLGHIMPEKGNLVYTASGTDAGSSQKPGFTMKTRMELHVETK